MSGSSHRSGSGTLRRSSARRTLAAALITGRRSMIRTDGLEGAVLGGGKTHVVHPRGSRPSGSLAGLRLCIVMHVGSSGGSRGWQGLSGRPSDCGGPANSDQRASAKDRSAVHGFTFKSTDGPTTRCHGPVWEPDRPPRGRDLSPTEYG